MQLTAGRDCYLKVTGFRNAVTGDYLNAATTKTWAITDAAGAAVASGTLAYTAASNGDYTATIDAADFEDLAPGARYRIDVVLAQSGVDYTLRLTGFVQPPAAG